MNHRAVLRVLVAGLAGAILAGTLVATPAAAVDMNSGCDNHPGVPDWFYPVLRRAADNPNDQVPDGFAEGDRGWAMMKIICNESSFDVAAFNRAGRYYGLGQMGLPAIDAANVRFTCYWHIENDCEYQRRYYQSLGALRYANQRYGGPLPAWAHWRNHGWW